VLFEVGYSQVSASTLPDRQPSDSDPLRT
jgi:hypothetical protein